MVRVVIITGSELRHHYVRMRIALEPNLDVARTYCCGEEVGILESQVRSTCSDDDIRSKHLQSRRRAESDMFEDFVRLAPDLSNPIRASYNAPNEKKIIDELIDLSPDLILVYGSCIIKEPLISSFPKRILNAHLGLSPYYRGAGTNYWPLVNNEPEYVGCTFMYLDQGIDTGRIIHQIRPQMDIFDGPHQLGNRLIKEMSQVYAILAANFEKIIDLGELTTEKVIVARNRDFTKESVERLYANLGSGMLKDYLENRKGRDLQVPILQQLWLRSN